MSGSWMSDNTVGRVSLGRVVYHSGVAWLQRETAHRYIRLVPLVLCEHNRCVR